MKQHKTGVKRGVKSALTAMPVSLFSPSLRRYMKTLIQHAETRLYLGKGSRWVKSPQEALAFLDEVRARDHCVYRRLANVSVVVLSEPGIHAPIGTIASEMGSNRSRKESEMDKMKPKQIQSSKTSTSKPAAQEGVRTSLKPAVKGPSAGPVPQRATPARVEPTVVKAKAVTPPAAPVVSKAAPVKAEPAAPAAPALNNRPKEVRTTVAAKIDVGFGNSLFIRGQGDGLSWEKGLPLKCVDPATWAWSTTGAKGKVVFKLLINDEQWSQGEDLTVEAGQRAEVTPVF
jgi:hypothetical protein